MSFEIYSFPSFNSAFVGFIFIDANLQNVGGKALIKSKDDTEILFLVLEIHCHELI